MPNISATVVGCTGLKCFQMKHMNQAAAGRALSQRLTPSPLPVSACSVLLMGEYLIYTDPHAVWRTHCTQRHAWPGGEPFVFPFCATATVSLGTWCTAVLNQLLLNGHAGCTCSGQCSALMLLMHVFLWLCGNTCTHVVDNALQKSLDDCSGGYY